jgi:hypothetical protein
MGKGQTILICAQMQSLFDLKQIEWFHTLYV